MDKLKMQSPNLVDANIDKIAALFPNCITEDRDENSILRRTVDFDQLRQELSPSLVDGPQERYTLSWPGKNEAILTANAPIAKTLRPCEEESVDFVKTKNIYIEGDNLDALKLLQETYLNKIKMIYIDPPYNTGNDFIYDDDFSEDTDAFLKRSNQKDEEGNRLVANTEANGRFHSDWLSMMYPRLRLARNLMRDDGVIFISIDDNEVHNLRKACDEVFGEDRFIAVFIWKSRLNKDNRSTNGSSKDHEYIICYGKQIRGSERDRSQYKNPDNDHRGPWASANMVGLATADRRPNLHFDLINLATGINYGCPKMGWRYEPKTMNKLMAENRILWPDDINGRPRRKAFYNELESEYTGFSSILGDKWFTKDGTAEIDSIFGKRVMDFPKPINLISEILEQGDLKNDIILDFFAGSSTTAHAVMQLNAEDGGNRKFIMVQIPEHCDEKSEAFKAGYKNISEIGKERIRRAGKKIKEENQITANKLDTGFRVFKVDTSNMRDVYYTPDELKQGNLELFKDHIKHDRRPEDLLFQVFIDWGLELTLPIIKETIDGKTVFFVDTNALIACFDPGITEELVKKLAKHKPLRVVFRDDAFGSDSVKINVEQIFRLLSPGTEVKAI
jgi:adenine-specific DNA-methyltransferase